jgi:hypothetical protein
MAADATRRIMSEQAYLETLRAQMDLKVLPATVHCMNGEIVA